MIALLRVALIAALTLGLAPAGPVAVAAVRPCARQDTPPTLEEVAARITALGQETGLEEPKRAELVARWKGVQGALEAAAANRVQAAAWQAEEAESRALAAGTATAPLVPTLPPLPAQGASRTELEASLATAQKLASDADARLAEINTRQADRGRRKPELATQLAEARAALEAARVVAAPTETDQHTTPEREVVLADAERRARLDELASRVALLEIDLAGFDVRGEALERRAKAWASLKQEATKQRTALDSAIQTERERKAAQDRLDAQAAADDAARVEAGRHAVVMEITRRNDELSQRRAELLELSGRLQTDVAAGQSQLEALARRIAATKGREVLARGTQENGAVLRRERDDLPDIRGLEARLVKYASELSELRLNEFDLQERQRELRLPETAIAKVGADIEAAPPAPDSPAHVLGLELLEIQSRLLAETLDELDRAATLETDLWSAESQLLDIAVEYKEFIDERVLWVRSTDPLWRLDLKALGGALAYYGHPMNWSELPLAFAEGLEHRLGWVALYLLAVAALFGARHLLRKRETASDTRLRSAHIGPTFAAVGRDLLSGAVWPVLFGGLAWLLLRGGDDAAAARALRGGALRTDDSFVRGVALGTLRVVGPMYMLTFVRRLTRSGGTGELYFGWGQPNTRLLRRVVIFGGPFYILPTFAAAVMQVTGEQAWSDSLGRLCFLGATIAMLLALHLLLRENGLSTPARYRDEESWVAKLRPLWKLAGIGGALALVALSTFGFDYAARQLHLPLQRSISLMLLVMVVQAVSFRWFLLARRRIQLEQARARREGGEEAKALEADELPDLRSLGLELRRAVRATTAVLTIVGLYWIWRTEIPALGALDGIRLYPFHTPTEGDFVFTASKLLVVVLAVFATGAVARRLPGLLDFLLLDRTGFTTAERYAVRSLTQYVVVTIGVFVALAQVGVTWSQLQWLAAAVSVGLGFGLQEIFANFVSGLILLFERPIRVGDIVTIGGMEGRITNIRIRATTLLDFDRREIIVPNKEFVTGSLINWTLSDPITRVRIPVGVSYGSDVALVHKLLLQAAAEVPVALREPKPHTVFLNFGESSLDFELRVFIGDRDHWLEAVNGARDRITALFREHGVEIPFPQRDLHLRSAAPLVETFGGAGHTAATRP